MSHAKCINGTTAPQGPIGWTHRDPLDLHLFPFENINVPWWQDLLRDYWKLALYTGVFYVVTIFGLQRWMRHRPAMNLKVPLFWWNFSLGVFSIVGFARTAPGLVETLASPNGFYRSICKRDWMDAHMGCWCIFFILSKPFELGDTLFTVLRKRPLHFAQWYHHLVTMVTCCVLGYLLEPIMVCYLVLNFAVHSLMYPYFALRTVGYSLPKIITDVITTVEFVQMIVGLAINTTSMYYKQIGQDCARTDASIKVFGAVYGSFLVVFGKLFYDSVIKSRKARNTTTKDYSNGGILLMSGCDEKDLRMEKTKKSD